MIARTVGVIGLGLCMFACQGALASPWYVDGAVSESGDGQSRETAFKKIQEGIDAASEGDTVIVAEGTYVENILFDGKNILLTGADPLDPDVVATTIIDGNKSGSVVTFAGTEDETCVLSGFTIRNGRASDELGLYGGGICGGMWPEENYTHATIRNNVITDNSAYRGGGLALCDGDMRNNTIIQNGAGRGGGLLYCHGTIESNVITDNSSTGEGAAGLYHCNGTIRNNTITNNSAYDEGSGGLGGCDGLIENNIITGNLAYDEDAGGLGGCDGTIQNNLISENWSREDGGGLRSCSGTIENNIITGNSADGGGGALAWCTGTIQNNTIVGNSAGISGGGLDGCNGTILNCIIWGNTAARGDQLYRSSDPMYSCVQCWAGGGEGNIAGYPYFVDPEAGDYHLKSWSPSIDAGDPSSEFSNEPQPNGGRTNMGAYGNTSEAASKSLDMDSDGLPDDWELHWFSDLQGDGDGDPDGDLISNITEYRYGWDPMAVPETRVQNLTKGQWYQTIQGALCESDDGDEIVVYPGVYYENIAFEGKNVVLRSTYPTDAGAIANTTIDGGKRGPAVAFSGSEGSACVLSGFTIQNGKAEDGGGICGGTEDQHTRATIHNNVITGNSAAEYGGGLAYCDGVIQNNTISGNRASWGGALAQCNGTVTNCIVWRNTAPQGDQLYQSSEPTYSCIQHWSGGGEGNIAVYPHLADPGAGDYRLRSWSPCIDVGDPSSDFSNEPQPNGGKVNMGAYGNTAEAASKSPDTDADGLPDDWELHWFDDLQQDGDADPDGDSISNTREYRHGWNPRAVAELVENLTTGVRYQTIQAALSECADGDEVVVYPGLYAENIIFGVKNVVLRSTDPSDANVIANTIIDGNQAGSVVTFDGTESESCVLSGFTIQNGRAQNGAGIYGGTHGMETHATIKNNTISANLAESRGGGLSFCGGIIQNNTITGNSARWAGGALYRCDGTIKSNVVDANSAGEGGGLHDCDGIVQNNVIIANSARWGGGLMYCGGRTESNTITGNSATTGGGLYSCQGTVVNCIIWGNTANEGTQLYYGSTPTYSCVQDWTGDGEGNIPNNPLFVDANNGDFRLLPSSPCIDAGNNDSPNLPDTDIVGMHRIMYGGKSLTVDMGAYEYHINEPEADGQGNVNLTWSSLQGKTYSVYSSSDMMSWELVADDVISAGDTVTTWLDETAPLLSPDVHRRYYRIEEKE